MRWSGFGLAYLSLLKSCISTEEAAYVLTLTFQPSHSLSYFTCYALLPAEPVLETKTTRTAQYAADVPNSSWVLILVIIDSVMIMIPVEALRTPMLIKGDACAANVSASRHTIGAQNSNNVAAQMTRLLIAPIRELE